MVEPFTHWFSDFLGKTPSLAAGERCRRDGVATTSTGRSRASSTVLALGGHRAGVLRSTATAAGDRCRPASSRSFALSRNKLYVDEVYDAAVVKPAEVLAFLARRSTGSSTGWRDWSARVPRFLGSLVRPIQNGLVQFYALSMALGLAVFLSFVVFRVTR